MAFQFNEPVYCLIDSEEQLFPSQSNEVQVLKNL